MARKPIAQEVEDSFENGRLRLAYERLQDGARGSGVHLTADECMALLRKRSEFGSPPWMFVANYSYEHEKDGVEAAVAETMGKFEVSRAEVFAARRRWKEYCREIYKRGKSN